ncbi:Imm61 family immunity protein [Microbacterium sp. NPDC077184]|uniref:Imm61 family immunity protein n=1 Tax=Microbacterium sp. NPDC077184 TaxID=3154764 RepID=UPI00342E9997
MPDGRIVLSRAERAEEPAVILSASTRDPVVAHLVTVTGDDRRAAQGLTPIRLPSRWDEPAPGFTASRNPSGWAELRRTGSDEVIVAMAGHDMVQPVVSLSYVPNIDLALVLTSYESPSGTPRLTRFVAHDR